jgi:hypothetical protein
MGFVFMNNVKFLLIASVLALCSTGFAHQWDLVGDEPPLRKCKSLTTEYTGKCEWEEERLQYGCFPHFFIETECREAKMANCREIPDFSDYGDSECAVEKPKGRECKFTTYGGWIPGSCLKKQSGGIEPRD